MTRTAAKRLLSVYEGSSAVADLLLSKADVSADGRFPGAPTAEVAIRQAKSGGAAKAVVIARSITDPTALDHLGRKDTRLGVRREVAYNEHTGQDTLEYLFTWALKSTDECAPKLWNRLPVRVAVSINRLVDKDGWPNRFSEHPDLGSDAELETLLWAATCVDMPQLAANAAARAANRGVEVESLVGPMPTEVANLTVRTIARYCSKVTFDAGLANRLVQAIRAEPYRVSDHFSIGLTEEARMVLLDSGIEILAIAAVTCGTPSPEVRAKARALGNEEVLDYLCAAAGRHRIGDDEARALMDAVEAVPVKETGRSAFYRHVPVDKSEELLKVAGMPNDVRIRVLRRFGTPVTEKWLLGRDLIMPRKGEWSALLADPGFALSSPRDFEARLSADVMEEAIRLFVGGLDRQVLKTVGGREAYESAVGQIRLWATRSGGYGVDAESEYLVERFGETFGDNPVLWDMALTLSGEWVGTLQALIDTTYAACGLEPARASERSEATQSQQQQQLALL